MRRHRVRLWILAGVGLLLAVGCATPAMYDYSSYRAHFPKSVLILPPLNETVEVNAPYSYFSTLSRPLAESGYYVFPVAVVDAFMKENGLPTSSEMHAVSLDKLREVFGADAVLYVTIKEYGQKYRVLSSSTVVKAQATLVDTASGTTIWQGTAAAVEGSGNAGGGLVGALVSAAVSQVVSSTTDKAHGLSAVANSRMIFDSDSGLLLGPYHPEHETDVRGR